MRVRIITRKVIGAALPHNSCLINLQLDPAPRRLQIVVIRRVHEPSRETPAIPNTKDQPKIETTKSGEAIWWSRPLARWSISTANAFKESVTIPFLNSCLLLYNCLKYLPSLLPSFDGLKLFVPQLILLIYSVHFSLQAISSISLMPKKESRRNPVRRDAVQILALHKHLHHHRRCSLSTLLIQPYHPISLSERHNDISAVSVIALNRFLR